jgi:hypothetical protein
VSVAEQVDARKAALGRPAALRLARSMDRVIVVRGKKVVEFDMRRDPPDDRTLLAAILGPSRKSTAAGGNLRAPALRRGKTLLVGFDEKTYTQTLR